jgi:serine protease Do
MALWLLLAAAQEDPEALYLRSIGRLAARICEDVGPSVVSIEVDRDPATDKEGFNANQGAAPDYYRRPAGPVSGTILESDGFILTSYFNVSGDVRKIDVTLASGRRLRAKLLGVDKGNDLALLKVEATELPIARLAPLEEVKPGQIVFVVGRAPDPTRATVTDGIVSATQRMDRGAIQVDAEMNYGSSGGVVVDVRGRALGIACRINPKVPWGQSGGVGFVARADVVLKALPDLKAGKVIEKPKTPWLGVLTADAPDGVRIQEVLSGSPAEQAGLKAGMVITKFDDKEVKTVADLRRLIRAKSVGDEVWVTVNLRRFKVVLAANPNE